MTDRAALQLSLAIAFTGFLLFSGLCLIALRINQLTAVLAK